MSGTGGLDRRAVLRAGLAASGGVLVMSGWSLADAATPGRAEFSAYVRIAPDGRASFIMARTEMGQGVSTSLAMLVAEELDLPIGQVSVDQAPADIAQYGMQITGGSQSIRSTYTLLRQAGAAARAMLVAEAAARWSVPFESCSTANGAVRHDPSGRDIPYGVLASAAAIRPVPKDPPLKHPDRFRLIGKPLARLDGRARVDGSARYGIDVALPGMRSAVIAHPPTIGGKAVNVDDKAARMIGGVTDIIKLPMGVAVVASNSWAAMKGRDALKVEWDKGPQAALNSAAIFADLNAAVERPGAVAAATDGQDAALKLAPTRFKAVYTQPFLAHGAMEPLNCVAHVTPGACEIWTGTQVMGPAQLAVAKMLGIPASAVKIHNHPMGGGFGRRLEIDGILTTVALARQLPFPVKLLWTRPDDIRADLYRPAYVDRVEAGLDKAGRPVAWLHRIAGSSIMARLFPTEFKGVDADAVECATDPIYRLPQHRVEFTRVETGGVPTSWWRGVGALRSSFVLESFIDELAHNAGIDPVAYRRALIDHPRVRGVLDHVATRSGWGRKMPPGQGQGVAVQFAFGSYAAMVIDVTRRGEGDVRVDKIWCAVDCGVGVNPRGIEAQVQGGALFGLSAAMTGEISIANGSVEQSNFDDYTVLRISEAPPVDVEIVASTEAPGGLGELATVLVAPALVNAIHAATGQRIRTLPVVPRLT